MFVHVVNVEYGSASADEWCVEGEATDVRNGCKSDVECLKNGRTVCDTDPDCFGIAWYTKLDTQRMRICRSKSMVDKNDGWRTIMKKGVYILKFDIFSYRFSLNSGSWRRAAVCRVPRKTNLWLAGLRYLKSYLYFEIQHFFV